CRSQSFSSSFPPTAVIICFHNECWSTLLRSVHSVLLYTSDHLLKEIILVDDYSTYGEQTVQCWLEPLLECIHANHTNVVSPVIDRINDDTFAYETLMLDNIQVGGFDWDLSFNWHFPPQRDLNRLGAPYSPINTPTIAGGLFSIHRGFFKRLGFYDPQMENQFGDVSERKALRAQLQCRSFGWYLDNVIPEMFVPSKVLASGDVSLRERLFRKSAEYLKILD
ncbi:hypothetical protein AHF37_09687, partial [Paragonimus kellicotti]